MQRKRMWITLAVGIAYVFVAMFIMLYAVNSREVVSEDGRSEQMLSESTEDTGKLTNNSWKAFTLPEDGEQEKVIVIDPYYNQQNTESYMKENDITLDIAKRIERKMTSVDSIKVYCTRTNEKIPPIEERQQLISETEADLYIGIALNESEDTSVYGVETVYNGTYFIPFFGNTELADCLERNVTKQVSGRANGLTQMTEEDIILQRIKIPGVILKAGYLSNEKEAALLNAEEYREQIAEGVLLAVQEAYEKMEKESK